MPKALEDLLGVAVSGPGTETLACARPDVRPVAETMDLPEVPGFEADSIMGDPPSSTEGPKASPRALPLVDLSASQVLAAPASSKDDVVAFDELFEKFCGAGSNQVAYFDECWSKLAKEKTSEAQAIEKEHKERQPKKPLFDVTNMDKAAKPIETEPVGKHQMNEKASQWQLRKDVPPYMIDRITMPSWQTWSKAGQTDNLKRSLRYLKYTLSILIILKFRSFLLGIIVLRGGLCLPGSETPPHAEARAEAASRDRRAPRLFRTLLNGGGGEQRGLPLVGLREVESEG